MIRVEHGDMLEVIPRLVAEGIVGDAIVTDPPYHLFAPRAAHMRFALTGSGNPRSQNIVKAGFMGQKWDGGDISFRPETWATAASVLRPGGVLLAFGGTRTYHRLATAIEDAGFIVQDAILWLYGCLSEDTQLVTPNGVSQYTTVKAGDPVLCYDPTTSEYSWQPVQEIYEYDIDDTVYRIQSDRTDQIVSRNHRCLVERGGAETFEFAEAIAPQREARVPVLEDLPGLLEALPGTYNRASKPESDMFAALQLSAYQRRQERQGAGRAEHSLREVREDDPSRALTLSSVIACVLQSVLPRSSARWSPHSVCGQQKGEIATRHRLVRLAQSGMERWRHLSQAARKLCLNSLCPLPAGIPLDGAQRRLCDGTSISGLESNWAVSNADGDSASRQPQSARQLAGKSNAVLDEPRAQVVRGWRGHQTDLARITPQHYRGKIWCARVATSCFVAVRNGKTFPTGNSGFPKHRDTLKPAVEIICVAYKPGGKRTLQVDECRIEGVPRTTHSEGNKRTQSGHIYGAGEGLPACEYPGANARWPANVCHDGSDEVMEAFAAFGETNNGAYRVNDETEQRRDRSQYRVGSKVGSARQLGDCGTAARFFYCAKAGKEDRYGSRHPTVKPVELIKWLVALATPKGGLVIDCFAGSGTAAVAALATGRNAILIERDAEYTADIRERVAFYEGEGRHSMVSKNRNKRQPAVGTLL